MKVQSSAIRDVEYDPEAQTLTVEFTHGGRYRYDKVPKDVHERLMQSASIGGAFQQLIRPKFAGTKL